MQGGGSRGGSEALMGLWKKSQRICRSGEKAQLSFASPIPVQLCHQLKEGSLPSLRPLKHYMLHSSGVLGAGQKVMEGN